MDAQHDDILHVAPAKRKPISSGETRMIDEPGSIEPACEPLLFDVENGPDNSTKGFKNHKQPLDVIEIAPLDNAATTMNQVDREMTEKSNPSHVSTHEQKGDRGESPRRIIDGWWQEMLCCALSIVALIILAVALKKFDNQPMPDWPSGITLNTVLACIATLCRTALLVPVTEGLAQAKWTWFKKKPRPLKDFEAFDKASRGLGGSLSLLAHTKGWLAGIIAAFLLSTTIATSTITQFAVTYPSRNVESTVKGSAVAWKIGRNWGLSDPDYVVMNEPAIARGVKRGIHSLVTDETPFREPKCATADCKWPRFSTLTICHELTNITHLVDADLDFYNGTENITLPNGVSTRPGRGRARYSGAPTFFVGDGPAISHKYLQNASILDYFAIYWDPGMEIPKAAEISFYWCINTYDAEVADNVLHMNKTASRVPKQEMERNEYKSFSLPGEVEGVYTIGSSSFRVIERNLNESLSGQSIYLAGERFSGTSGTDMLVQATKEVAQKASNGSTTAESMEMEKAWWIAVDGMASNVASSLTNTLLPDESNVKGVSLQSEVYVQVRWSWLALLSIQVVLSVLLLVCIIVETAKARVEVMKGSTVPVLFAISAEEKARIGYGRAEMDSLGGKGRQPTHVELRRVGQNWILKG